MRNLYYYYANGVFRFTFANAEEEAKSIFLEDIELISYYIEGTFFDEEYNTERTFCDEISLDQYLEEKKLKTYNTYVDFADHDAEVFKITLPKQNSAYAHSVYVVKVPHEYIYYVVGADSPEKAVSFAKSEEYDKDQPFEVHSMHEMDGIVPEGVLTYFEY